MSRRSVLVADRQQQSDVYSQLASNQVSSPPGTARFMTAKELEDLTDYKRPSDQIRWLSSHAWRFEIGASGRPKVATEEFMQKMAPSCKQSKKSAEPNFNWMK